MANCIYKWMGTIIEDTNTCRPQKSQQLNSHKITKNNVSKNDVSLEKGY